MSSFVGWLAESLVTDMRRIKGYVAGPMRNRPKFNFANFDRVTGILESDFGVVVFNPAARDRSKHGADFGQNNVTGNEDEAASNDGFSLREALADDLQWIALHADFVVTLDGWEESKGANAEVALANAIGIPVFHESELYESGGENLHIDEMERPIRVLTPGEVRSVSSTGAEKGTKLARYDLIPALPLLLLAEHFGRGAEKYEDRNWEKGYEWSKTFAALNRHLWQFWNGEDIDPELGSPHMVAVAWHAFVLLEYMTTHGEFDDRPRTVALQRDRDAMWQGMWPDPFGTLP